MCGECCMNPKYFHLYKIFEPNLAGPVGENETVCSEKNFPDYDSTVTHGFGPVKMTLDLFKPKKQEVVEVAAAACSADDQAVWTKQGSKNFQDDMSTCGKKCLGASDCVKKCVEGKEKYSDGCSACFGDLAHCTAKNCMFQCISGRSTACDNCVKSHGCESTFANCSGLKLPTTSVEFEELIV